MSATKRLFLLSFMAFSMLAIGILIGWWTASHYSDTGETGETALSETKEPESRRKVLYWYDPMQPQQHFDKPGPSPFMDMDLIPKYADSESAEADAAQGIAIDATLSQNIAMRLTKVVSIPLSRQIEATGLIGFNERDIAIVQTRSGGFVERVWPLAEGDSVKTGQALAELLVPDWAAAQQELLALRELGDDALLTAARERLRLLGMPETMIKQLQKSGRVQNRYTITTPIAGVIQSLDVRAGMTLNQGQSLARINGLGTVWLEVAVPEAQVTGLHVGDSAKVRLTAFPARDFYGRVFEIVPTLNPGSRTGRVRIELPNPGQFLRPGQSAQVLLTSASEEQGLAVPTEAVIRTGKRSLVMVALEQGRYRPQEVRLGREIGNKTVIVAGLKPGQEIVSSGQFLLDSEASLNGIAAQPFEPAALPDRQLKNNHADRDMPHSPATENKQHHHAEGAR
ncbi:efflux RND transporter periplasmic adaptor subunit [Methylomonas sp. MgM2]